MSLSLRIYCYSEGKTFLILFRALDGFQMLLASELAKQCFIGQKFQPILYYTTLVLAIRQWRKNMSEFALIFAKLAKAYSV